MIVHKTAIDGAFLLEPEPRHDDRGYFARTFCAEALADLGMEVMVSQCGVSFNRTAGTLRGMHYQAEPHGEAKLIRCSSGRMFDALIDLRADSPSYRSVVTQELAGEELLEIFAPRGVAHGFLTLAPETTVEYQMSTPYRAEAARGVRWDDPVAAIHWPSPPAVISERDACYPDHHW